MPRKKRTAIEFPAVVLIDNNEQNPFTFTDIKADSRQQYLPLIVRARSVSLFTGDYSLEGFEKDIAIERKSLSDLYGTLSRGRARFEDELSRLDAMRFAMVVVEAPWRRVLFDPPLSSSLLPKSVSRSVIAWRIRFRGVHWDFCEDRRMAELVTFRTLQRFYEDEVRNNGLDRVHGKNTGKTRCP